MGGKGDQYQASGTGGECCIYLTTLLTVPHGLNAVSLKNSSIAECMDGFLYLSCVPNCPFLLVYFNAHLSAFIYQMNVELSSRHTLISTHRWVFINLDVAVPNLKPGGISVDLLQGSKRRKRRGIRSQ